MKAMLLLYMNAKGFGFKIVADLIIERFVQSAAAAPCTMQGEGFSRYEVENILLLFFDQKDVLECEIANGHSGEFDPLVGDTFSEISQRLSAEMRLRRMSAQERLSKIA